MKIRSNPFLCTATLAASVMLCLGGTVQAQTSYFWDGGTADIAGNGNGASNPAANGTWNTTIKNWESGATPYVAWANSLLDTAVFAGTGRTVTLGTVNVGTLSVRSNSYIFGSAVNSGSMTFSNGFIDIGGPSANTVNTVAIRSNLIGSLSVTSTNNTQAGGVALATISGNNTGLTSFTLNLNSTDSNVFIDTSVAALGAASATVKLTKGILVLNASSALSYNAWNTEFAGGTLRSRGNNAGNAATYNGNGTLTANSAIASLTTNNLTYAGTMDLGNTGRTLTVAPGFGGFIDFTNTISNTGNILINSNAAGVATGTVRLSAANTFSGTATTTQNLGTLALNHINALQNATLDTGVSGTQAVTFTAAGTTYNIGAITGSDTLSIGANTISVGNKAGSSSFGADIAGTGGLTKTGSSSTQTLTAATSYSGATSITGGTLSLTGTGAVNSSSGITINGSGAKLLHTGGTAISPAVTLTQGTLTGSGTVNTVNVGAGTGGIISNNNGVAGAALTIGNLTLAGAANIDLFSNSTSAPLVITSALTTGATAATITANNSLGWANGTTYNLITYGGGSIAGSGNNFIQAVNNLSARQNATWANTGSALQITINGDNPRWMGDTNGNWNLTTTNNWKLVTGGGYTNFLASDDVIFDDNATGTRNVDIDTANVAANSTIFNNTTSAAYTLGSSGGFGISAGSLTKNNTGTVTITSANTYAGPTNINGGSIVLSGAGTLGTGSALTLGGGALDLGGLSRSVGAVSITAESASGDTIANGSLTGTSYSATNTSGNAIISASLLANGAIGFTKTGTGTVTLAGVNTYTGNTDINAGSILLSGPGTLGNGAALNLGGGSLNLGGLSSTVGAVSVTAAAASGNTISNGSLTGTSYAASNISGDAIISANLLVNGSAGFTKSGAGTTTLSGLNTYTGATAVSAGTLKTGSSSTFSNTGVLNMSGTGTFDLGGFNTSFTNLASAATNTITTSGAGAGTDVFTISSIASDTAASALFTDNGTRKLQVNLTGNAIGSWQATSNVNNTYSGGLILSGTVRAAVLGGTVGTPGAITSGQFGTGAITVNGNSQIQIASSNRTLVNDVIVNGNAGNGNRSGTFRIGTNSTAVTGLVISGNITANLAEAHFGADPTSGGSTLLLSGKLTGDSGFRYFSSSNNQAWTTTLNNATGNPNDYNGNTTISSSLTTLALGASNQIPNGAGKGNVILTSGFLDLAGFDETINGLSGAGTIDNVSTGTTNTLTFGDNNSTGNTFSGSIKNTTGSLSLTKIGTGNLTLSGTNSFTGGLTIRNGSLTAGGVATALGGASAGVANGLGTVTLGDTAGTNAASLLVSTTGLNFANPLVLATNGALILGNTGTAISTTFSGGVTGNNDLTIVSNATTGTISLTTSTINHTGKLTNTGAGSGTTTISSSIGANVTEVIENSSTSTLLLSGSNSAFAGNYSVNSGRIAIGAGFAANTASDFNLGSTTAGTNNTTLSFVNNFNISNDINVRSGNSGTKTLSLGTGADLTSTLSGTVTLDDNLIIDASGISPAASLTLSGNIVDGLSGAKGLTKNGAGVVILSGTASDFSGSVSINAGELRIAHAAALGESSTISVGGSNNSAMSLTGGITLGDGKDIKIKGGGVGGFFGSLATATTNTGTSEWQGSVTIDATTGTRIGSQAGTLKISGNIGETTANSQLVIRNSGGITILSGTNSYTGETTINASGGELQVSGGSAIHNGGVVNVVNSAGNVFRVSGSETIGALTGGGNTTAKVAVETGQTLTLSSGTQTFAGVIEGAGALTVDGATQTLTNTSTYTGATTVSAGTLIVNGNISTSSLTTVNGTGTLGGNGTVGDLTIAAGGSHNPGNSPGMMNTGDYTMAGSLNIEAIGNTPGVSGYDQVNVTGNINLSGTLNTSFTGGTYANGNLLFILLNDESDAVTGTFSGLAQNAFVINYGGFDWNISYTADSTGNTFTGGNDVALMAIPEPDLAALLGTLGTLALLRRRRSA